MVDQMAAWWVAGKADPLGVLKVGQRVVQLAETLALLASWSVEPWADVLEHKWELLLGCTSE